MGKPVLIINIEAIPDFKDDKKRTVAMEDIKKRIKEEVSNDYHVLVFFGNAGDIKAQIVR